ncbi:3-oxoacyl-[acyl-carrier-protein] synthase-3 [Haloactinospora alba]|uniref:3-oxoacyl-[acyl-carrier-protein] synthase-3 n=1 Tax=Haloactinospora alba TaxID=405555 RepID=A0A543NNR7_9ACTN|nr:beta-ketoacyl-ACP synthase 3 [Haloactinospora alba]TQN33465.1 3-oxoacyl-[acyl-carrier-protein] synthase-3 [Haloactinospora alba]
MRERTPDTGPGRAPTIRRPAAGHPCAITALGSYRPSRVVHNAELAPRLGVAPDWIEQRTGIASRHQADTSESLVGMGTSAAREALGNRGIGAAEIDCLILATMTNTRQIPALAPAIARELGADRAGAYDINAACAGFGMGLTSAVGHIASGSATNVLVVAVERMVDVIDPTDRNTASIFADGAGAAVVSAAAEPGFGPVAWGSDGTAEELFVLSPDPTRRFDGHTPSHVRMDGPALARWFGSRMVPIARQALSLADLTWSDISAFVPHQANGRLTNRFVGELDLPDHVTVARSIAADGNTSAASIPLALEDLVSSGRAGSGELALLLGFGVGITWAAQVARLP